MSKGGEEMERAKARRFDGGGEGVERAKARRFDEGGEAANLTKSIASLDQVMKGLING